MFFFYFISFLQQKHVSRFILQLIGAASHVTTKTRALKLNSSCFELLPRSSLFLFVFQKSQMSPEPARWLLVQICQVYYPSCLTPPSTPAASTPGHNKDGGVVEQEPRLWNLTAGEASEEKKKKNQMCNQRRDKRITTQNCLHMNVATKRRGRTQIAQIQVFENPRFVILQLFLLPDGTFHQI